MKDTYSCIIVKIIINREEKMLRSVYNIAFKGSRVWSLSPQLFDRVSHGELIQPWGIWPKQWVNPPMSSFLCGLIRRLSEEWESRSHSEELHWALYPWECILSQASLYLSPTSWLLINILLIHVSGCSASPVTEMMDEADHKL